MDKSHPANILLQKRLDFWFTLTRKQQRMLDSIGYSHLSPENISIEDLKRVSKSKKLENMLVELKQSVGLRLVA